MIKILPKALSLQRTIGTTGWQKSQSYLTYIRSFFFHWCNFSIFPWYLKKGKRRFKDTSVTAMQPNYSRIADAYVLCRTCLSLRKLKIVASAYSISYSTGFRLSLDLLQFAFEFSPFILYFNWNLACLQKPDVIKLMTSEQNIRVRICFTSGWINWVVYLLKSPKRTQVWFPSLVSA